MIVTRLCCFFVWLVEISSSWSIFSCLFWTLFLFICSHRPRHNSFIRTWFRGIILIFLFLLWLHCYKCVLLNFWWISIYATQCLNDVWIDTNYSLNFYLWTVLIYWPNFCSYLMRYFHSFIIRHKYTGECRSSNVHN